MFLNGSFFSGTETKQTQKAAEVLSRTAEVLAKTRHAHRAQGKSFARGLTLAQDTIFSLSTSSCLMTMA